MSRDKNIFASKKILTAYKVFDVLRRADAEYVPKAVFDRVTDVSGRALRDVLQTLARKGVLKSRTGRHGGFKWVRPVSLYELFEFFAPSRLPKQIDGSYNKVLNNAMAGIERVLKRAVIKPEKIVPLEYELGPDDILPSLPTSIDKDGTSATDGRFFYKSTTVKP